MNSNLHKTCQDLIVAYKSGDLGQTKMPEDANPSFSNEDTEMRLAYFTLPMALNYQRNSYTLWENALKTFNDTETRFVFNVNEAAKVPEEKLRSALMKYKLALQPNKHVKTWQAIAKTVSQNWGSLEKFIESANGDFLKLKEIVNIDHKKGFPYLSGPKIFNYWSFIITTYGGVKLKNRDQIEIAPDTHITQCSVKLGVITQEQADTLARDEVSNIWRNALQGSGIDPIDMHPPLWFWSRNGFLYKNG